MAKVKPDEEILQFAIGREMEANLFYLALADRVKDEQIRKIFKDLAEEELEHKAKLELEVMKTGSVLLADEKITIPEHEYIVSDGEPALDMDYRDVLMLGMEKEEAAFRTYVNLIPHVDDGESREVLLALAEEEVKHKIRFETEYDMLLKKSGD
ncbi:MAG: ferritin family protein [Planctomycetota bacterium]|jgi:rubrerythrin